MELIRLPKAAENVTESTVVRWLVEEGEAVEVEQPIVEMVNEKAEFEIWPETAGVVLRILAPENSTVPVGYIIAVVGDQREEMPDAEAANERLLAEARRRSAAVGAEAGGAVSGGVRLAPGGSSRVRATPAARRIARERGVDLAGVKASLGVERAITADDVEAFISGGGDGS